MVPEQVPSALGRTWVFCYCDPQRGGNDPSRAKWYADFCQALAQRLGPPRRTREELKRHGEETDAVAVTVYTFPGRNGT